MLNDEIIELNDEIEVLEENYINAKFDYEQMKAELQLNTDFASQIGKAKPTVAEKEAFIELQIGDKKLHYKDIGVTLSAKKRLFEVMLRMLGDGE